MQFFWSNWDKKLTVFGSSFICSLSQTYSNELFEGIRGVPEAKIILRESFCVNVWIPDSQSLSVLLDDSMLALASLEACNQFQCLLWSHMDSFIRLGSQTRFALVSRLHKTLKLCYWWVSSPRTSMNSCCPRHRRLWLRTSRLSPYIANLLSCILLSWR